MTNKLKKALATAIIPLYLTLAPGCVSTSKNPITPSQANQNLQSSKHDFYINKTNKTILADPKGGLEFKTTQGWQKADPSNLDLLEYKAEKITLKDDNDTVTYEGIFYHKNTDEKTTYNLRTNKKTNTFQISKEVRTESDGGNSGGNGGGSGGGSGGGGGGGGGSGGSI
jgi:uncharacterized membrane protein YgcG